jgi:enterochelin esterase-like enzyme
MSLPQAAREVVMSLIGLPLVLLLAVLAVATPVTTYLLWSRVRGGAAVVVRAVLLLAVQVCAVLLVAVLVNDYGYFYTSWSEVLGNGSGRSPSVSEAVARHREVGRMQRAAPGLRVVGDSPWSSPGQWVTRGRVESVQIDGPRSGLGEHAYVYLPPQYFAASWRHRLFPGVEVMTGYPGNEQSLVTRMHYPDQLLSAIRAHRAGPMVLVMLRPSVSEPRDTECTDVPGGPQALTFFSQDVPVAVEQALRVRLTGWGVMGDSTGGYCATKLALMRSDVFTSAVSFSGYYHALRDSTTGDLWDGSLAVRHENDPLWRLTHLPEPPVSLFASIARGEGGPQGYQDTVRLQHAVAAGHGPLSLTVVVEPDGGHNFAAWSALMPRAFSWLSRRLGTWA